MGKKNKNENEGMSTDETVTEQVQEMSDETVPEMPSTKGTKLTDEEKAALKQRHFDECAARMSKIDKERKRLEEDILSKRYPMDDDMKSQLAGFMVDMATGFAERITKKDAEPVGFKFKAPDQ